MISKIAIKIIRLSFLFLIGFLLLSLVNLIFILRPEKIMIDNDPSDFGLEVEDVRITTNDGVSLSGWYVPGVTKRVVLLIHGYPAEKRDLLSHAMHLNPEFSVLLIDLRYFGESEGGMTTLGIKEVLDVSAALDYLENKNYQNIGVFGFSMGGSIALRSAAFDERINVVVSHSSFSDLGKLGEEIFSHMGPLRKPMVSAAFFWSRFIIGESLNNASPIRVADKINSPVLLIHDKGDDLVPFEHVKELSEAMNHNQQKEVYFYEKGFHGSAPYDFHKIIKDFFDRYL